MNEEKIREVNRLNKLVAKAVEFRKQQRDTEYINNESHYEGLQWNLASLDEDSPFIVKSDLNHLKNAVDIRLGSLYASEYYGELKPLSRNDVTVIEDLNILYQNEWRRLKLDGLIKKAVKNGCKFDNGYIEFNYDTDAIIGGTGAKREGVITAEVIDTANIYLDPSAESIDKCNYIVKKMKLTMKEIKREYPDWYTKLKDANITGSSSKDDNNGNIFIGRDYAVQDDIVVVNAIYEKYKTKVEIPIKMETDVEEVVQTSEVTAEIPIEQTVEPMIETIDVTKVKISYIVNETILEINKDYPFEEFPIIPFQWEEAPQTPYGIPLLRGLTVPQKVANLIESSINNIAVHYTIPTWVISDDSGLDVDDVAHLINALGVVWKVTDINSAIKQLEPPKVNSDIIQMGQTFVNYIKEYSGSGAGAYTGNIGTAGSTAEGTTEAINRATIIDNNPLNQIEDFVERLTRLLIKFMVRYYAGDTISIRIEQDKGYEFKEFVIDNKFDDVNFDFSVNLGSKSMNDKNRQYNLIKDIYQLQNQYKDKNPVIHVTDVVKAAQLDNYNEMKNRLDNNTEEALQEKASLIVELINIGNTSTPNGSPLIDSDILSEAIMDVLNDDNDLSVAESVVQQYQEYQEKMTQLKQQIAQNFDERQNILGN